MTKAASRVLDKCPECGAKLHADTASRIDIAFYKYEGEEPTYDFDGDWHDEYLGVYCENDHDLGRFKSLDEAARALLSVEAA
jgi:hypothetical protein